MQALGLSWCKATPYGEGKFGGKVSENYLADCHLFQWLYSQIEEIGEEPPFVEPNIPKEKWLKKTNVAWLKARGLEMKGTLAEVRDRVAEYMAQDDGPPDILGPTGGPIENVTNVICCMSALTSWVMCGYSTPKLVQSVEWHIQLFLNSYEIMDKDLQKGNKCSWVSHYNFLCLLNVPKMILELGPLQNLWEGSYKGEGFIRHVKPEITMGLRKNWANTLMTRVLKKLAFKRVMHSRDKSMSPMLDDGTLEFSDEEGDDPATATDNVCKMFHKYGSIPDVTQAFLSRKPLSCVMYNDSKVLYCCTGGGLEIAIEDSIYKESRMGLHYHEFRLGKN